ncbi:helix-turn-helix transcriptional regulator [Variovorax paradoxus]|uniref:S24 family peptidase n=1 Tax=Variovorax paradoxus TaxID=34073 RepID=UPI001931AFC9|nr:helix-turn-helix transcriptional regulator [Variovorax paradoxus]
MAAKPDPLSETRREALREYCRRKGWLNDNGSWAVTAISKAIGKPTNKVSDLLNGKGSFGAAIARDIESAVYDLDAFELDGAESQFVSVRRVDVKFSNGHGQVVYYEDERPPLSFRADFLRKLGIPSGKALVVDADGVSNEPKIWDGSVVLVNSADTTTLNNHFYAFRVDGELLIKRLTRLDGIGILATAENSDFAPKNVVYRDPSDFEIIGRAVWTGNML